MCCCSGVARHLETTFLQREGLQPAPTGANICTPEGALSDSQLTSDLLKDGDEQKKKKPPKTVEQLDINTAALLSQIHFLQNDWHQFISATGYLQYL